MQGTAENPTPATMNLTRRRAMRIMAGATGAAAVGVGADTAGLEPVGEADALVPAIVGGAAAGGAIAIGWALRETEVIGSDDPPEGLTADALKQRVYETIRTRESENASTFVDNQNILNGADNAAYVDGKLAAIEALNAEESKSSVQESGTSAVNDYATTVKKNLLKSWNESVKELQNIYNTLDSHPDLSAPNTEILQHGYYDGSDFSSSFSVESESIEMPDGSQFDLDRLGVYYDEGEPNGYTYDPIAIRSEATDLETNEWYAIEVLNPSNEEWLRYLDHDEWSQIWTELGNTFESVRNGIITWVDKIYSEVQSGELEIEDLITPRERAAMMTDDEEYPQAVADLLALNVPVDLEREATVEIPSKSATLVGTIGVSDDSTTMETGTTYSPSDFGTVYFTYDVSTGEGDWSEFQSGIDGGTVTFTAEPYEETTYHIQTTAGEQADVTASDFSAVDGSEQWTVDISDQLETAITEIDSVGFDAGTDETQYETVQIQDDFTVTKFEDSEGNEHDSAEFESSEPQTDSNYITQDEWDQMAQQNEELIEKYEESQNGGGGGGFLPDLGGGSNLGIIAILAAGGALLLGRGSED